MSMTRDEFLVRGISRPDVILVSGDAYIDSAFSGVAVIGRVLEGAGYSVGIIAQPDTSGPQDITALGQPRLFWGVSAGCVDSEVANFTALGKPRRQCDFTPGGKNDQRPDRACIVYANLIRRYFKDTVPIVLGGIEASLRRVAHYDQRTNRVRRSILLDSKADILVYGMGEKPVLEIASRLSSDQGLESIPGTCVMSDLAPDDYLVLPGYEAVQHDPEAFGRMFRIFYRNSLGPAGQGMVQKYGPRYLVHHPQPQLLTRKELDRIHELPFVNDVHPLCRAKGEVRAVETIRESITTHRGCFGECSFCAIAVHQGRSVISRSLDSIVREAQAMAGEPGFSGIIRDVGGPTANMYGSGCDRLLRGDPCSDRQCIGFKGVCSRLGQGHHKQKRLLARLKALPGVKRVNIASGIRHDLVLADTRHGPAYLEQVIRHHVAGQMKIAPEHCSDGILKLMNKPPADKAEAFAGLYRKLARRFRKNIFLSCYVMAAHPGCTLKEMQVFSRFAQTNLRFVPEQVQIFTPTPATRSTVMYYTGADPLTGQKVWTEKGLTGKQRQKEAIKKSIPGRSVPGRDKKKRSRAFGKSGKGRNKKD